MDHSNEIVHAESTNDICIQLEKTIKALSFQELGQNWTKTFSFQGAKIFNNLLDSLQTETSLLRFKESTKDINFDF